MNLWLAGATVLLAGLVPCLAVCLRAPLLDALVAVELAATIVVIVLMLLAEGFERPSYFVLPLVLAVVGNVGGFLFVRLYGERWL